MFGGKVHSPPAKSYSHAPNKSLSLPDNITSLTFGRDETDALASIVVRSGKKVMGVRGESRSVKKLSLSDNE